MAKIKDIISVIEQFAPLDLQADFDNCGLIYGDVDAVLNGVLITLDTNPLVVREAIDNGCNLIIEHHPSIFNPIKKIDITLPQGRALAMAIQHDIAIYSAHTNIDFTHGGLNDRVMELLDTYDITCLNDIQSGARVATLKKPMTLSDYANKISDILNDTNIATVGSPDTLIEKIAVINGSGGGSEQVILDAISAGADLFISADFKYNVVRLAKDLNYAIISFGHYTSEIVFIDLIAELLTKNGYQKYIHKAKKCFNPYN